MKKEVTANRSTYPIYYATKIAEIHKEPFEKGVKVAEIFKEKTNTFFDIFDPVEIECRFVLPELIRPEKGQNVECFI